MFTGIVTDIGTVRSAEQRGDLRLTIATGYDLATVDLERPLRLGDELGGHIVTGHVDAVGEVADARSEGDSVRIEIKVPQQLAPMIAPKGSIALDGVSLTVNSVTDAGDSALFMVNIIPHTARETTLGEIAAGRQLNVEVDVLARYIERMLAARAQ